MDIILGIDPGSRKTGYGIIKASGQKHEHVSSGVIQVQGTTLAEKLRHIHDRIAELIEQYQPTTAAIEQVFMHRNASSALKLGQARGAAIVVLARYNLAVGEYSAKQVKQSIVGYGAASKGQIQHMVSKLLNICEAPAEDAADALAIAICHACYYKNAQLLKSLS